MTDLRRNLQESEALRDAAKALVLADVELLKADLGCGMRADQGTKGAIWEGVQTSACKLAGKAKDNSGIIAGVTALLLLLMFWRPLFGLAETWFSGSAADETQEADGDQEPEAPMKHYENSQT